MPLPSLNNLAGIEFYVATIRAAVGADATALFDDGFMKSTKSTAQLTAYPLGTYETTLHLTLTLRALGIHG